MSAARIEHLAFSKNRNIILIVRLQLNCFIILHMPRVNYLCLLYSTHLKLNPLTLLIEIINIKGDILTREDTLFKIPHSLRFVILADAKISLAIMQMVHIRVCPLYSMLGLLSSHALFDYWNKLEIYGNYLEFHVGFYQLLRF